jgi:hypothetical protein
MSNPNGNPNLRVILRNITDMKSPSDSIQTCHTLYYAVIRPSVGKAPRAMVGLRKCANKKRKE